MTPPELSIVVPTFNERDNIAQLVNKLSDCLGPVPWEVVFVDDNSPDLTADAVRQLAQSDARVRVVHRYGRRGLSSACIEGILSTSAPFVAVMDADMQHDETILPRMLEVLKSDDTEIVVGSRYADGGGFGTWAEGRVAMSKLATRLANRIMHNQVGDPMSGFFMLRRDVFMAVLPNLSSIGFKILLDIFASAKQPLKVVEVPYRFRTRQSGESKLDSLVLWEYALLLIDKTFGHIIPIRFVSFAMVGFTGVFVHLAVLSLAHKALALSFVAGQTVATAVAITSNFFLNNTLTYRDKRLKGRGLLRGWLVFNLVCFIGALANVGVAGWLYELETLWVLSAIGGILVGVVWNYAMSAAFAWGK